MIVVKIELWPLGSEERRREIGRMYIANDGSGTQVRGNYKAVVCRRGTTENPLRGRVRAVREGHVENYPRKSANVWKLIMRCLRSAFPEEK